MAGIDDLIDDESLNALVDSALTDDDDDETQKFEASKILSPRGSRSSSRGSTMAGKPLEDETLDESANTQRLADSVRSGSSNRGIPSITFDTIYKRAGLPTDDESFTVYKLAQLYDDDEIASLDADARAVAVKAILKSHNVDIGRIFDDAVARREALVGHDERLQQNIGRVEEQVLQENAALQAEIEEFANPRLQRMEANEQRLERLRRDYERWNERMIGEQERLVTIVEPWGGDTRLKITEKLAIAPPQGKPPNDYALSGEDVFDDPPGPRSGAAASTAGVGASASNPEWGFGGESSETLAAGSSVSVDSEIPAEYHVAAASSRDSITDEFDFIKPQVRFLPYSLLEGLLAGFACVLWLVAGLLLTAQLVVDIETVWAWSIGFGGPVVLAILGAVLFRRGGWWTSVLMMLFYFSLIAGFVAHYDANKLAASLRAEPLVFIDEAGLAPGLDQNLRPLTQWYADVLVTSGLAKKPAAEAEPDTIDAPSS